MIGPQNTSPLSELHVARKGVVLVVLACLGCTRLLPTTGIEGEGATCDAVEQPAAGEGPHEEEINNDGEIDHPGEDHGAHIRLPVFDEKDACGNEEHGQKKRRSQKALKFSTSVAGCIWGDIQFFTNPRRGSQLFKKPVSHWGDATWAVKKPHKKTKEINKSIIHKQTQKR